MKGNLNSHCIAGSAPVPRDQQSAYPRITTDLHERFSKLQNDTDIRANPQNGMMI